MRCIRTLSHFCGMCFVLALGNFAYAAYPEKTVRIVVGYPPGGGGDIIARAIAQRLSASLKANFIVDNKPGAGAMLAADLVAKAAADAYTLLLGSSAELTISPVVYSRITYNPEKDFSPIALLGVSPVILVANSQFSGKDIRDVIAEAKSNPGKLTIGTGGPGTPPHMAAEELKIVGNIDFVIAPYKGGAPAQTDAIAGHIPLVFTTIATALPAIKGKQLKALTVIASKRSALLPEVPTTVELGLRGYTVGTWFGLFAPANTPREIIEKLHSVISQSMLDRELRSRFESIGLELATDEERGSDALRERVAEELVRWRTVVKKAGINTD